MDAKVAENNNNNRIIPRIVEDEMKQSYLSYSMSVIVGRALPDVRDGLKPVHRRILYAMYQEGLFHNKKYSKCAGIVGDVLKKFHPHGDTAVYDSLVRMAQPWNLRYLLVDGQGNFGSIDGDNAAAYRYTEARFNKLAEEMLQDINKETVDFIKNYDGTREEPTVLPSKIPNLLINGSSGIAVGMATNIPPHNIKEVCDGVIAMIDNESISSEELMQKIPGPDFPTGGIICGTAGLSDAYKTGKGKIIVRGKALIEESKGRQKIIIKEIPYQVNKTLLIEQIADLVKEKKLQGISDLRDESDRDGMRIVIELKTGTNSDVVLNNLYNFTRLQETFGIIMLGLVNDEPKVLGLKDIIHEFIDHRKIIIRKRILYDLKQAEDRSHILEGIIIALNNIDAVIKLIKSSKSAEEAKKLLLQD